MEEAELNKQIGTSGNERQALEGITGFGSPPGCTGSGDWTSKALK